jgi:hypothetical protein
MAKMARKEEKKAISGERLRQVLKDLVRHPYITHQGLGPPLPAGEENQAAGGEKQDARPNGDRTDPCA